MKEWCIQGWRQQSTDREQILAWLSEAKQLGFERYNLFKQGTCYWLCCASSEQFDIVAAIRSQVDTSAAVVVQQWSQQLVVVAWQHQTLLACCQFSADKHGLQNFLYVARNWLDPHQINCELIIAGSATRRLFDGIEQIQDAKVIAEFSFEKWPKLAKMRSLRQSPPWLRQRILLRGIAVAMLVTTASVWWFWPAPPTVAVTPPQAMPTQPAPLQGWQAQQVAHVDQLLSQVSFLAGWRVSQWQLNDQGETLSLHQSYGSHTDLLMQLPSQNWQLATHGQGVQLHRQPPEYAASDAVAQAAVKHDDAVPEALDKALLQAGFQINRTAQTIELQHLVFDPFTPAQWRLFIRWLSAQPNLRIQQILATPEHLSWRLTITVQQP
jgi:hypothetical protein